MKPTTNSPEADDEKSDSTQTTSSESKISSDSSGESEYEIQADEQPIMHSQPETKIPYYDQKLDPIIQHFNDGNLLYGVQKVREQYDQQLASKGITQYTIDRINKYVYYNTKISNPTIVFEPDDDLTEQARYFGEKFCDYLQKEIQEEKYLNIRESQNNTTNSFAKDTDLRNEFLRYLCEASMRYVVTQNISNKIHFDLAEINLVEVFRSNGIQDDCYTASELREVVRLMKTNHENTTKNILLYFNGNPIDDNDFSQVIDHLITLYAPNLTQSPVKKTTSIRDNVDLFPTKYTPAINTFSHILNYLKFPPSNDSNSDDENNQYVYIPESNINQVNTQNSTQSSYHSSTVSSTSTSVPHTQTTSTPYAQTTTTPYTQTTTTPYAQTTTTPYTQTTSTSQHTYTPSSDSSSKKPKASHDFQSTHRELEKNNSDNEQGKLQPKKP